ncbi:high-affinity branched-chain amino acid transport ATP-binding protein LivG [Cupriavidus necator N-1]|uniref:High-affinity branched-chain amino acid transport ATP-binding protein LivG n=1 Tax=Cupriavidus necator (strain ATCC 43291 / DSM 13513 / CCUG 52238 / LMG 8453 / N-1) TaxID=1042878 RepID=G0ETE3_CUPNN|nr:ABC transporter ATP-binding protein [Cupriavidus necator]AEI75614.1 high-affinity branched-chain amino acid transport ATP-binding protein LivG [Cupriavidus necator N-1]MDX6012244.1 ABC transporter ATP-binding protein [Cupriavidus necator]
MNDLLAVRGVTKRFGGVVANHDISLQVPHGSIVGLIGPNGSGKTTLFNSIVGYHPIDGGSIAFDGREISRLRVPEIARLGLVRTFQQTRVFGKMSCLQNLLVSVPHMREGLAAMCMRQAPAVTERARQTLRMAGLEDHGDRRGADLSFGQQKLLEICMALMNEPRLLLLDEPTAGVNPVTIDSLIALLRDINARLGITLLVIEHNMRVMMQLAGHIYCLAHGEVLAQGSPAQITANPTVIEAYLGGQP